MSEAEQQRINVTEDGKVWKTIVKEGTGECPKEGDKAKVHYVGTLESNGEKFDSSRDRDEPFEFTIGSGVIQGWSLGVATMKVGERSIFHIDSEFGYGESGSPPKIPGGATLVFDIELLSFHSSFKNKEEAITAANKFSDDARPLFRDGKFAEAVELYNNGIDALSDQWGKEVDECKLKLQRNLSIAYARCQNWKESLKNAEEVLKKEANDPKALLRKIEAEINLENLEVARQTLEKGLSVTKNDPAFVAMRSKLEAAEKEARKRENALFKKMVA
ncbi:peptidyl-prolyl cis-trans isomerase, FKBP-type family protein [Tritrichomonas foetus]|uniref:peptidylprolyl isomerase n=1 Tax=Tritrichomonas foetus TaxID=1144522 RepID=A0A1J4JNF3_9EUKA|nr:peptidyl-prolyl cis-trans isomerase, FKBP-type family protein [Tritrichomonas foetus]|eukprot:OHS99037.1 peptidyl-prolyl cis-trans isomerase, FKBP-type family protein [Tritrichomonas foetus]